MSHDGRDRIMSSQIGDDLVNVAMPSSDPDSQPQNDGKYTN